MKNPPALGLSEMWLGAAIGAGLGVLFVSVPWPDNIPIVGFACLLGTLIGLLIGRARMAINNRGVPALAQVEFVGQKSFLLNNLAEAKVAFREIIVHSVAAERFLEAADKDFTDGAFAPFWDQIERAANELAAYKNSVEQLGRCVHVYQREALLLENTSDAVPALQLGDHKLPDARPSVERFSALVRKAQTNFQFAMIYEQRKTNQLLYAGFGTLGAAIYALGESVNLSLTTLSKSMNRRLDNLLATSFAESDFQRELKDRRKDSQEALDRTFHGRLDG